MKIKFKTSYDLGRKILFYQVVEQDDACIDYVLDKVTICNGWRFCSVNVPSIGVQNKNIYIRGQNSMHDNKVCEVNVDITNAYSIIKALKRFEKMLE